MRKLFDRIIELDKSMLRPVIFNKAIQIIQQLIRQYIILKLKSLIIRPSTRHLLLQQPKTISLILFISVAGDRTLFGCAKCVQGKDSTRRIQWEFCSHNCYVIENIVRKRKQTLILAWKTKLQLQQHYKIKALTISFNVQESRIK